MIDALDAGIPVLITGASSGIGQEFARRFAQRGHDLVLVARRVDRIEQLAEKLSQQHHITATPLAADLMTVEGRATVEARLRGGSTWVLINSAGFGSRGRLAELEGHREIEEVSLNVVAVHQLTVAVIPGCLA